MLFDITFLFFIVFSIFLSNKNVLLRYKIPLEGVLDYSMGHLMFKEDKQKGT